MLKKAREATGGDETADLKNLSRAVLESPRQIWLAGLGALSRAQAEGMKMFDALVKQGESVETRTRHAASTKAAAARHAAQAKAKEMQQMAGGTWDKLEKVFEDRVARALSRLGVHTQSDVDRLAERVDALSDAVNQLIKQSGGTPARRPARSPTERLVKGAVSTAAKTASPAPRTSPDVASTANRTARRTVRTAKKVGRVRRTMK